jgi:hypothetical protein
MLIELNNIKNYHYVINNLNHKKISTLYKSIIKLIITILINLIIIIKEIIIMMIKHKNHNNRRD